LGRKGSNVAKLASGVTSIDYLNLLERLGDQDPSKSESSKTVVQQTTGQQCRKQQDSSADSSAESNKTSVQKATGQ
jgi:hypothetical protein